MSSEKKTIFVRLGKEIASLREARDLSVSKLADLAGLTEPGLRRIERGEVKAGRASLRGIARGLGLDQDYFLKGEAQTEAVPRRIVLELDLPENIDLTEADKVIIKQHLTHAFGSIIELLQSKSSRDHPDT